MSNIHIKTLKHTQICFLLFERCPSLWPFKTLKHRNTVQSDFLWQPIYAARLKLSPSWGSRWRRHHTAASLICDKIKMVSEKEVLDPARSPLSVNNQTLHLKFYSHALSVNTGQERMSRQAKAQMGPMPDALFHRRKLNSIKWLLSC